jgi:hypothetical protein
MSSELLRRVHSTVERFIQWLDHYGETSCDLHSFYASPIGRRAKNLYYNKPLLGTIAVGPTVLCEALSPKARELFGHRHRFPIADAHYAMGFAFYSRLLKDGRFYARALHFLKVLGETRSPGYKHFCWGYPYDWVTKNGTIPAGTPLITTTPYVYEAFWQVYRIDQDQRWREIMHSIAEHAINDIKDFEVSPDASTCSYTPHDTGKVVNANAYRAFLLAHASKEFSESRYWQAAERNLNFVLQAQRPDGSWYYSVDGKNDFIDHFHTCFVLKALAKIEEITGHEGCRDAIERGVAYYIKNLFDDEGLPKPFAKRVRLTVYRRELYDYAESINLGVLLKSRFPEMDRLVTNVLRDLLDHWSKPDGSFRSRKLYFGWDNVPMHRWAQSQVFRSLCFLLHHESRTELGQSVTLGKHCPPK